MKIFYRYIGLVFITLFVSCKKEEINTPKVSYDTISKVKITAPKLNAVILADLPIQFTGTNVLLFPIGEVNISDGIKSKGEYSYSDGENYRVSNYSEFEISGNMNNIKFQRVGQDSLIKLTDKKIAIQRITYLKNLADKTKKQFLVYLLEDLDSNQDGKADSNDIKNLYISDINGLNFIKLSPEYQEVIDWNIIDFQNKLYFRTIEDINKNGAFDKEDKLHYYVVDLLALEIEVKEYNPVN
jgi:hypothetical protein